MNAVSYYAGLIDWVFEHVRNLDEYMFLIQSIVTCTALFWLLRRAWEVLWTPLPKLISILGVEVPDPPEVSLACIKSDSLTLHWAPSTLNKAIVTYLIQVNGVNVGESPQGETLIIEGLKPGHFYNVRVIAVGSNNFQAGSRVIRLRTLGRDGQPRHGTDQNVSDLSNEDDQDAANGDDTLPARAHGITVEAVNPSASTAQIVVRDHNSSHQAQRRNTTNAGARKHSPSTTAENLPSPSIQTSDDNPETIQELQRKQDATQKEVEDLTSQGQKECEDLKQLIYTHAKERDEKARIYKEKEEATERLRKEVKNLELQNRQSQNRKTHMQKMLQNKQSERRKMQDDQARWKKELIEMETERESWRREKEKLSVTMEAQREELRESIRIARETVNNLGKEIEMKGLQIKKLEEERKTHGGTLDEEQCREWDAAEKRRDLQWESTERAQFVRLQDYERRLGGYQNDLQNAQANYAALMVRQANNPLMYHANSSGVDFDPTGTQGKAKSRRQRNRKSRTNTISSPTATYPIVDSQFPSASIYNNFNVTNSPGYVAPPPYVDLAMSNDTPFVPLSGYSGGIGDADIQALTDGAPLSPTATSLLPSTLFNDDDLPSPDDSAPIYGPELPHTFGPSNSYNDPQSPGSSRSASFISSPHASSHNLAKYGVTGHDYGLDHEQKSLASPRAKFGAIGSPARPENATTHRNFGSMFTSLKRSDKNSQDGPALGSLKPGQSHSFPRSTDDPETSATGRHRRISFSTGWSTFMNLGSGTPDSSEGNGPAPARQTGVRRQLGFSIFGSRNEASENLRSTRDSSSPRPISIASSDFPRPSTDSAPFGWGFAVDGTINKNSPLATDWSVNAPQTWSSNPSRRPSVQHASSAGATSGIVSEEDEFLPPDTFNTQSSPPPVGIIGTRPPSSHNSILPKLNPNAPKFELSQTSEPVLSRLLRASKGKTKAGEQPSNHSDHIDLIQQALATSPPESRKSRDTPSIRTQHSVAESTDSLEKMPSNATSDLASSTKEKDSTIRQLFRKGSSFGFQAKDTGLFGRKKGGSTATSDHNTSVERDESFDEFGDTSLGSSLGTNIESTANNPRLGGTESGDSKTQKSGGSTKEGRRGSAWGRAWVRNKKGKESADVERSEAETTGTEDEA